MAGEVQRGGAVNYFVEDGPIQRRLPSEPLPIWTASVCGHRPGGLATRAAPALRARGRSGRPPVPSPEWAADHKDEGPGPPARRGSGVRGGRVQHGVTLLEDWRRHGALPRLPRPRSGQTLRSMDDGRVPRLLMGRPSPPAILRARDGRRPRPVGPGYGGAGGAYEPATRRGAPGGRRHRGRGNRSVGSNPRGGGEGYERDLPAGQAGPQPGASALAAQEQWALRRVTEGGYRGGS